MIIDEKNIIKMSILHKAIYIIPTKILMAFSTNRTKSSKICMEPQTIPGNQSNLEKEEQFGSITHPDFKLYYKATVIKRVWY